MWLLKSEQGPFFHVTAKTEHTVGRKNGSLTLSDDQSISRLHAKFYLASDNPNSDAGIILIDAGSKYGTYVNGGIEESKKIAPNENKVLKHTDKVRFGLQWHKYTVIYMPLLIVISSLNEERTKTLESILKELNAESSKSWTSNCTHFVMSAVKVSVKTVCALGAAKPIVTPEFFQSLRDAVNSGASELPDPNDFIPDSGEPVLNSSVVSFAPNTNRSTLFESLTFIATTPRQMSRLKNMVLSAGGRVVLFSECNISKKDMCSRNVLLMQNSPSSSDSQMSLVPDDYHGFAKYVTSKGYRCIPESDIGMSMVYCSIEKFCNPTHNPMSSLIDQRKAVDTPSLSNVIVPETQNEYSQDARPDLSGINIVINETIPSPATQRSSKRLRGTGDEEEGAQKIKCGENQTKVRLSSKSDKLKQKEEDVDDTSNENGASLQRCKDSGASAAKAPSFKNRTLKDMFASKKKPTNKVEEPQVTEEKSSVVVEESNLVCKLKEAKRKSPVGIDKMDADGDVDRVEDSDNIVIEESESFSFADYAKKVDDKKKSTATESVDDIDVKKKTTVVTSVDMFDCSTTSKEVIKKAVARTSVDMFDCSSTTKDEHNFLQPEVPKSASKKKDGSAESNSASNNKNACASTKKMDVFNSSIASTSKLSTTSLFNKKSVEESSDKDFDFSDEDEPNEKKSLRSADMFSSTTAQTTATDKFNASDDDDDFEFEDINETRTSNLNTTRNSNSNQSTSTLFSSRKSKRNQKEDDFDFPDEAPSQPKRTRQSSLFSDSLFSNTKKATVKTERNDSFEDDNAGFGFGSRSKRNGGKICLTTFIDRQKKPDNSIDGDQNDIRIKDEPADINSDDSDVENVSSTYAANVEIKPMIAKLDDLSINKPTPKDENSNQINYKKFKKVKQNCWQQSVTKNHQGQLH
ncbi:nibrin isoform X2 [Nilaparvata lugens]|uniref:nibrin isoform X2 n=1 Tax=Nilaparvata lugens TaxID=108931 RepID=UPI00193D742A|nr:nibrin isoform X2 [Nilaparvata lugens]